MPPETEFQQSAMLRLISMSACAIIVVFVTLSAVHGMLGKTAPVVAGSAVALAVAVTGLAWVVVIGTETTALTMTVLTAVGLAGALQIGLLPEEAGYLIIFVALIGIGMELPPLPALTAGLIVFAAANLSFLVAARLSATNIVSERLPRLRPDILVVVLTTYSDDSWVFSALQAGAGGFLTKDAGAEEIRRAITDVAAGHAQFDPSVQRRLLDALSGGDRFGAGLPAAGSGTSPGAGPGGAQPGGAPPGGADGTEGLTPREAEVGKDAHQPPVQQDRRAGPGAARRLRVPQRPGLPRLTSATVSTLLNPSQPWG
jgi:DNA-binding NarL/FixJ family response regulator